MPKKRPPNGPIDKALAGLHEAISRPQSISLVETRLSYIFPQIINGAHRNFLKGALGQICDVWEATKSERELQKIANLIDEWNEREFPTPPRS
jgi:hypothetical protein